MGDAAKTHIENIKTMTDGFNFKLRKKDEQMTELSEQATKAEKDRDIHKSTRECVGKTLKKVSDKLWPLQAKVVELAEAGFSQAEPKLRSLAQQLLSDKPNRRLRKHHGSKLRRPRADSDPLRQPGAALRQPVRNRPHRAQSNPLPDIKKHNDHPEGVPQTPTGSEVLNFLLEGSSMSKTELLRSQRHELKRASSNSAARRRRSNERRRRE